MKILSKINKIILSIGILLIALPKKIIASDIVVSLNNDDMYRDEIPLYGVRWPPLPIKIWNISKMFLIPIVLVIGLIAYFKRSKSSIKKKIFVTIAIIIAIVAVYIFGDEIIRTIYSLI